MPNSSSEILNPALIASAEKKFCSVEAKALGFRRADRWVFQNLNFSARPGSVVVLSGCSGAGKSSLLSILFGQNTLTEGELQKTGLASPGDVGLLHQELCLSEELSVIDNILTGRIHTLSWWKMAFGFSKKDREEAWNILCDLELAHLALKPVKFLSGGERQRVAVGRILFQSPKLILADEPVSALDPRLADKVLRRLKWEAKENSKILICALHERDLALDFADQIIEFC